MIAKPYFQTKKFHPFRLYNIIQTARDLFKEHPHMFVFDRSFAKG